ncbi:hypothetical protein [Microbacterium sp. PA5]|uniref:hypothetical protein n=1 Tax=Microbacterium sp. PA5 TaxID=3416654 RepID=UPI003CEE9640
MTQEIDKASTSAIGLTDEQIDQTAKNVIELMDEVSRLPDDMPISQALASFFVIHVDHEGKVEPEQNATNYHLLRAVMQLEVRVLKLERKLRAAGDPDLT